MEAKLDKLDLVKMLKGTCPPYEFMDELSKNDMGEFTGGFSDKWSWNEYGLMKKSEEFLYDFYDKIKKYWIDAGLWR